MISGTPGAATVVPSARMVPGRVLWRVSVTFGVGSASRSSGRDRRDGRGAAEAAGPEDDRVAEDVGEVVPVQTELTSRFEAVEPVGAALDADAVVVRC